MGSRLPSTTVVLPCNDELAQDQPSCKICLKILFEPSTTPCGHNFCRKCLQSSIRSCPICKQSISNEESCTLDIALSINIEKLVCNTIQLLFPDKVEVKKAFIPRNLSAQPRGESSSCLISKKSSEEYIRAALIGSTIGMGFGMMVAVLIKKR